MHLLCLSVRKPGIPLVRAEKVLRVQKHGSLNLLHILRNIHSAQVLHPPPRPIPPFLFISQLLKYMHLKGTFRLTLFRLSSV